MRYKELFEAPITDIQVHGDLDSPGSFNAVDRQTIKTNILQGVYVEKLKKIPFDLNVFVLNKEGLYQLAKKLDTGKVGSIYLMGQVIWDKVPYIVPEHRQSGPQAAPFLEPLRKAIADKPSNSINLILGSGYASGGGWIKMTPWMLIHRLLHTVNYDMFGVYSNIPTYRTDKKVCWWDVPMMKSIEDKEMDNSPELFLEMATEYLIRGSIRINYDKLKDKSAVTKQNYKKIINEVEAKLKDFCEMVDHLVNDMKGTTRYI